MILSTVFSSPTQDLRPHRMKTENLFPVNTDSLLCARPKEIPQSSWRNTQGGPLRVSVEVGSKR